MLLEKNGERFEVPLDDLYRYTAAHYLPSIEYADWSTFAAVRKETVEWTDWMSKEQRWLGHYFEKELLSPPIPPVFLRWIDDQMGWGVFAERELPPNFFVSEYTGVLRKRQRNDRRNAYCFEYLIVPRPSSPYLIDAELKGNLSRYINHSKGGNLECSLATVDGISHIVLHTARTVHRGEQLLYDYGPLYWKKRKAIDLDA